MAYVKQKLSDYMITSTINSIHGTKYNKDNQSQSLKHPCRSSLMGM